MHDSPVSSTRRRNRRAFDLLDVPGLGRFLRWRHARTVLQIPLFLIAAVMIWDGLTGSPLAPKNAATVITWVHYRGFVTLALLVAGNLFCMACPFMLPRNMARKLFKPARMWPRRLRNKWVAIGLFVLFLFTYELFDLWATPWWTAWIIIAYFLGALILDSLFKGAPFCKYVCPIGQFNTVSSLISPLEVTVRDPNACVTCQTKDCIKGRDDLPGCELWLFQERKVGNLDCTFCLDCVHACPHDNVGISLRTPGLELADDRRRSGIGMLSQRTDITVLISIFTFGALLNAFGMVSPVYAVQRWLSATLGLASEASILGLIFTIGLILEPLALLGLAAWSTRRLTRDATSIVMLVNRYAVALLPLGFGMWLAHYSFHFLSGFWSFLPVLRTILSDIGIPFAWVPRSGLGPLVDQPKIYPLELGFIGLGTVLALWTVSQIAERTSPTRRWQAGLPWGILIVLLAVSAIWLVGQPMEMRGTVFSAA